MSHRRKSMVWDESGIKVDPPIPDRWIIGYKYRLQRCSQVIRNAALKVYPANWKQNFKEEKYENENQALSSPGERRSATMINNVNRTTAYIALISVITHRRYNKKRK